MVVQAPVARTQWKDTLDPLGQTFREAWVLHPAILNRWHASLPTSDSQTTH